jgi:hypothetical protein
MRLADGPRARKGGYEIGPFSALRRGDRGVRPAFVSLPYVICIDDHFPAGLFEAISRPFDGLGHCRRKEQQGKPLERRIHGTAGALWGMIYFAKALSRPTGIVRTIRVSGPALLVQQSHGRKVAAEHV